MKSCLIPQISLTLVALITMLLLALVACGGGGPEELEIPVKSAPGRLWAPLGAVKAIRPAAAKVAASSHPRSGEMLEGLTRALPPGGTEESPRGRR